MLLTIAFVANAALASFFVHLGAQTRLSHFYGLAVFNGLISLFAAMAIVAGGI